MSYGITANIPNGDCRFDAGSASAINSITLSASGSCFSDVICPDACETGSEGEMEIVALVQTGRGSFSAGATFHRVTWKEGDVLAPNTFAILRTSCVALLAILHGPLTVPWSGRTSWAVGCPGIPVDATPSGSTSISMSLVAGSTDGTVAIETQSTFNPIIGPLGGILPDGCPAVPQIGGSWNFTSADADPYTLAGAQGAYPLEYTLGNACSTTCGGTSGGSDESSMEIA